MKFNSFILGVLFCALCNTTVLTQNKKTDSLLLVLKNAKEDSAKVNTLYALSWTFRYSNIDTAQLLANEALTLATALKYEMGIADANRVLCALHASLGKFNEGLRYGMDALTIYDKLYASVAGPDREKILEKIGGSYMVIGHNHLSNGNLTEGLKYSLECLKIKEKMGDKKGIGDVKFNIGNVYLNMENYPEALKYYRESLEISKELNIKADIAASYNVIGWAYIQLGNYPEALNNCTIALKIASEVDDKGVLADIYNNLGIIFDQQGKYSEALRYYFASLEGYIETGIREQLPWVYNNIAQTYLNQKKYDRAEDYMTKALSFAKEINKLEYIILSYKNWAKLDSAQGNYKQAYEHYKFADIFSDSLVNEKNSKKIVQQQMQYEFKKKEDSLKQKQVITETKLQLQHKQKYFYWTGIVMLGLLSIFVFLNFRNQKKINKLAVETHARQKNEMELQNQQAILNERLRISSELHDEVGATLSGIAMYSHLTKEQMKAGQTTEIEKSLNVMQQSSAQMVDKLNDIVWLINPEQDSLQKLIERLEEYATDMAAIKIMKVKITIPEKIAEINLPVDSRRNIYLFCKEAINNAVKYSQGSLLELTVKEVDNKVEFSVSDNGKGFDAVMVRRGNGLENMQKRADEIGAKLILHSKLNEGAYLSLQCEITH